MGGPVGVARPAANCILESFHCRWHSVGAMNLSDEKSRQRVKDILLAVSLANLFFMSKWAEYFHTPNDYYRKMPRTWVNYTGILLNIGLVSLIFWCGKRLTIQSKSPVVQAAGRMAFLAVLLIPLNLLRGQLDFRLSKLLPYAPFLVAGALAALFVFVRWNRALTRAVAVVVLLVFPFFLF